jgi:DNA-binding transcriptional MocR family regulator
MNEREFKGIWIPAEVWLNPDLTITEKALLAEIDSFSGNGKSFYKSNDTIQMEYGVSRPTISKAIKKLESLGYISSSFDGRVRHITAQAGRKYLSGGKKESFVQNESSFPAEGKNQAPTNTIKKTDKTTLNKGVDWPFDSDKFRDAWRAYLDMRKAQHRFTYKSLESEQTALHQLQRMSNGNEATAIAIIAQSIAWCWKGLFPLKQQRNEQQTGTTDGSLIKAHLRNLGSQS